MNLTSPCPCGSNSLYDNCCGIYHTSKALPLTAEKLMRSRYSAFVLKNESYLLATWHPDKRPAQLNLDEQPRQWLGLKILFTEAGGINDVTGIVKFVAKYKVAGRAYKLIEKSRFEKIEGKWIYIEGEISS